MNSDLQKALELVAKQVDPMLASALYASVKVAGLRWTKKDTVHYGTLNRKIIKRWAQEEDEFKLPTGDDSVI